MKRKLWFYLFWIQFGIILLVLTAGVLFGGSYPKAQETDIASYLDEHNSYAGIVGAYEPEQGYIPNEEIATKVGGAVIDGFCKPDWVLLEAVSVEYDPASRLWRIQKSYFPYASAIVILEQDTGKVLALVRQKL